MNNPTDTQKRIEIAKACGWTFQPSRERERIGHLIHPTKKCAITLWRDGSVGGGGLPEYTKDLNAMHEAEKTLFAMEYLEANYRNNLRRLPHPRHKETDLRDDAYYATAAQRAEAFGKTLNLWTTTA